jgi:hypothetical protein
MCLTNNCDSKKFETKIKGQWQFTAIPHISACLTLAWAHERTLESKNLK